MMTRLEEIEKRWLMLSPKEYHEMTMKGGKQFISAVTDIGYLLAELALRDAVVDAARELLAKVDAAYYDHTDIVAPYTRKANQLHAALAALDKGDEK